MKPQNGLLRFQRSFSTVSPAAYREQRVGWCEGVHFPIYPNIYYTLNYPGDFNKRLSLKLLVLPTKIPVTCVGALTNLGLALQFSSRALARSHGWDAWLPWQELPSADSPTMAPPGPATVSEPTSSLKTG